MTSPPKEPKISYPSFSIPDAHADEFQQEYPCKLGDVLTCTIKIKVTSQRADEYGKSLGFDVLSIDDAEPAGEETGSEDDANEEGDEPNEEEQALGYKRPPASDKEVPEVDLS